jgi:chromate reductase, NAD(P)H dehydrogenase (quinone)
MKRVFAISGSTRSNSANAQLIKATAALAGDRWAVTCYDCLDQLPHFNPDLDSDPLPEAVTILRNQIEAADGLLICTPEYVFSLPGSLKNALEWMVSTTVLSDKPAALITASAAGEQAHESLQLILSTLQARFTPQTALCISGIRGKITTDGYLTDVPTQQSIEQLIEAFTELMHP